MALKGSAGCGRLNPVVGIIMEFSILSILTPNNSKSSSVGEIVVIAPTSVWPPESIFRHDFGQSR
jgi:hypothetical protein